MISNITRWNCLCLLLNESTSPAWLECLRKHILNGQATKCIQKRWINRAADNLLSIFSWKYKQYESKRFPVSCRNTQLVKNIYKVLPLQISSTMVPQLFVCGRGNKWTHIYAPSFHEYAVEITEQEAARDAQERKYPDTLEEASDLPKIEKAPQMGFVVFFMSKMNPCMGFGIHLSRHGKNNDLLTWRGRKLVLRPHLSEPWSCCKAHLMFISEDQLKEYGITVRKN